MAILYLVRHAQASFGSGNYDQLSELGFRQAPHIKRHFGESSGTGKRLWRGDMQRHRQTTEHSFPATDARVHRGLNEFDHMNVLSVHQPAINDRAKMMEIIIAQPDPKQFIEDEFRKAMLKWINNEIPGAYTETFAEFRERISNSIADIINQAVRDGQDEVVAVTSGGVISLYTALLTKMPIEEMIEMNQQIVNTSVSAYQFNEKKTALMYYNNYSHLPADLVTIV